MIITFNGKINTRDVKEDVVFGALKEFLLDNFQEVEFEESGKDKTLKHKNEKT